MKKERSLHYKKIQTIIITLSILSFSFTIIGGSLYYFKVRSSFIKEARQQCITNLNNAHKDISLFLEQYKLLVKMLAHLKETQNAILKPSTEAINEVNYVLDTFCSSRQDTCYLLDKSGLTIASSNRHSPFSFVGENFSFRPYFKNAIKGVPYIYPALGTTSKKRGIYFSHPVYSQDKSIIGVAVIKASVDYLESKFLSKIPGIFFFVNGDGIIFISNKKEWILFTTKYLTNSLTEKIKKTRQMGNGPWLYSGFKFHDDWAYDALGKKYLLFQKQTTIFPGWQVYYLLSEKEVLKNVHKPILLIAGPFIILIILAVGCLVVILIKIAQKELHRREEAEKKLRQSEEKYRSIYHNTPAMLHSIDRNYRLLRVSDYWLETTGYTREEVIGKKLTDFFTEQSKKLAEEKILPEFFKHGVTNNVHYQFVKKNGEIIDIILSCYGIRNEEGEVVETLAISMDVTERLKEQKELQKAKKQLKEYSNYLEKLVKQRTREISAILQYTQSIVYLKNNNLEFRLVNPRFEEFFNVSSDQVIGKRNHEIFNNTNMLELEKKDLSVLKNKKYLRVKETIIKEGEPFTFLATIFPIFSESNEVEGICGVLIDITELENTQKKLKKLSQNIIEDQERERERIAKELHDELGQVLTVLNMDISWLKKKLENMPDINKRLSVMGKLVEKTIDEVRYLAYQLRPGSLDHLGLTEAIESLISDFEKRTEIIYSYKSEGVLTLNRTTSVAIYRIVQEAITNAVRHANPQNISIRLFSKNGNLNIEIEDDGCGFDVSEILGKKSGFGLMGMLERAELAGGTLNIISHVGVGTKIKGSFPIN